MKSNIIYILLLFSTLAKAQAPDRYEVENFMKVNSTHLDFSPIPYKNGIIFTSTRDSSCECKDKVTKDITGKDNYTDLYYASFGNSEITKLKGDLNGIHHDGVASVFENTIFISRTNKKGRRRDRVKDSKIYKLKGEDIEWKNGEALAFGDNEFATCHPSITADGKKIYFASNRPGGFGGMDIWVTQRIGDGWTDPKNLGDKVNTAKNELFPYISATNDLYFASNGQEGALNLDIYKATGAGFAEISRLPEPLNSEQDDFGFAMNKDATTGYFSSNREGGKGGDDIYKWLFIKAEKRAISVIDALDLSQIPQPTITISAPNMEPIVSSSEDVISMAPDANTTYTITISKAGYDSKTITVTGADLLASPEYKVPIGKAKPLGYTTKILVKSRATQMILPNAKLKIVKECNGKTTEQVADANAVSELFVECNCKFSVTAMQSGYNDGTSNFTGPDCNKPAPTTPYVVELEPVKVYKKGDLITLKDIYYDYDKSYIRPDAALILDELVAIMLKYPSMEIDFGSHTDSRGSDAYNKGLSQRRTDAAKVYLVSKGVAANRVVASGYGEDRLLNQCKNGVKCSDEEHQMNRRTEVRVTKIQEENVEVRKSN
jgi:outer membrane protein OmpA-like peptidoglycan-associated protein